MTYGEKAVGETIDRLLHDHPDLDPSDDGSLDNLDQFHIGGAEAVDLLIPTLTLALGNLVLDVGSGLGGPARQIARRTGNQVVGIDITAAYVDAARDLTTKANLADLVTFAVGDIATFEHESLFQAAITMRVQMNVQDKTTWFEHIARRLAPGARLAIWEVCQPGHAASSWPMPWSLDGTDSFVVSPESLLDSIERAGFTASEWTHRTTWVRDWISERFASGLPRGPASPMLLDDGYARVVNYTEALRSAAVEVWQGSFTRNAD